MGVRGLSTFFNNNPDLSKPYKLHDTTVIIDGNNLIHLLYFSSKVDCVYGGDYNRYAASIKRYFSSYTECNINPIVIFDGGYDVSDRKFKTVLLRSRNRLTLTQHIAKYGECAGHVLPINAQEVFRNVLLELGISYAQCDYEADDQVTALANHYKCPVLSDDSDFYIFDIPEGYIKLSSVESTVHTDNLSDCNFKYLKCQIYYIDKFLSYFPGVDRSVLPLFGTLVGNDFVHTKDFEVFYSNIQLPKQKYKGLKINQRQRKIIGVLSWLRHYTLEDGIKQVLCRFKKEKREQMLCLIKHSVDGYKIESCNLVHVLTQNPSCVKDKISLNSKLVCPCGEKLPINFILAFHQGYLPSFFLNVINLHRIFLPAQVENTALESSFLCSRHVRQVLYGILLNHQTSNADLHKKSCLRHIEEYDRRSGSVQRFIVEPVYELPDGFNIPKLNELYNIEPEELKSLLLKILDCPRSLISAVPNNLQLLFASIIYWLKNSLSIPVEEYIYALILCIMYFSLLLKSDNSKNTDCDSKHCAAFEKIYSLISNISCQDALFAVKNFKKYLQKPIFNRGNPLILHIVHSYSELQTCILYSSYLNMLFGNPFEFPKLHNALSGTLLYNLTKDIISRPFPDLFVSELLGRQTSINVLFNELKQLVIKNVPNNCFIKIDRTSLKDKKHSSSKKKKQSGNAEKSKQEVVLDSNKFKLLSSFDDSSDIEISNEIFI